MGISEGFEKFYYLTLMNSCSATCHLCRAQNNLNPTIRDKEGLKRAFQRIRSGHYQAVLFPPNFLEYPYRAEALALAQEAGVQPILQLHRGCTINSEKAQVEELIKQGVWIEMMFDDFTELEEVEFWRLETCAPYVYFTFVPTRNRDAMAILKRLPTFVTSKLQLYCPPEIVDPALFLACDEIYDLELRIQTELPHLKAKAPMGIEIWNPNIPAEADLEPLSSIQFKSTSRLSQVQVSVIITTHQSCDHLLACLTHLSKQKLSRDFYEVVVVDDGSDDGSFEAVRELINAQPNAPNFKYVFYKRHSYPLAPIGAFRQGPARNLGAKHADGSILVFLNANLLCPNHFLEDVLKQHRSWDVVQYQRFFLKKSVSSRRTEYAKVDLATDSQTSRGGFWERFYLENDWKALPNFWKYTSFAGLSIKANLYQRTGGSQKDYLHSALEGAFFGYKLSLLGLRWKLRNLPLYELSSDLKLSRWQRWRGEVRETRESARTFYLNTLEPSVYSEYFESIGEHIFLRRVLLQVGRLWMGRLLLAPLLATLESLRNPIRIRRKLASLRAETYLRLDQIPSRFLSPFTKAKLSFLERSTNSQPDEVSTPAPSDIGDRHDLNP